MSKSESTIVESGDGQSDLAVEASTHTKNRKPMLVRQLARKNATFQLGRRRRLNCSLSGKLRRTVQVRRTVRNRDRRDIRSPAPDGESNARPPRLSQKSAQKCQHEENRGAANARQHNWSDHIRSHSAASITGMPMLKHSDSSSSKHDPTPSNRHVQVREACELCENARACSRPERIVM